MSTPRTSLAALLLPAALALAGCAQRSLDYVVPVQPEPASGFSAKPGWSTRSFAVAAANPLATDAGLQVLRAGGSAVDAAVAVQMVLTLVEPQSSGIGGGAFMLHSDGRRVQAFDGRETAPAQADERLFLQADGRPMPFIDAVVGGRSVGTPGTLAMLAMAHAQHGRLPWAQLMTPALTLAEQGFKVSPRLNSLLGAEQHLRRDPVAAAYFYDPAGLAWPVGHVLKNPALAKVLREIAVAGPAALQRGEIAQAMVDKVRQHPTNAGRLSLQDLAGYQPRERAALCHAHDAAGLALRVCGMPPPSSGGIAIGQILGMLQHTAAPLPALKDGAPSADWLHYYAEASRLAFADRAQFVGDPDFVPAPGGRWDSLLDPAYLRARARIISAQRMPNAAPGNPGSTPVASAPMPDQPESGTSHISIVDAQGNALAMTTTIEDAFGSRQMVHGFLLNNELTDFSFSPADAQGRPIANRVQPLKRPRSSMSPTLVFDRASGELLMSAGSPGGALIIHFTAKTLLGTLHWGLNAQQAIDLPNFGTLGGPLLLEEKRFPAGTVSALRERGHEVREVAMTSGLQAIARKPAPDRGWFGGADPRREGVVMGD